MRSLARALARELRALARLLTTLFPFLRRPRAVRALVAVVARQASGALHGRTIAPGAQRGMSW